MAVLNLGLVLLKIVTGTDNSSLMGLLFIENEYERGFRGDLGGFKVK